MLASGSGQEIETEMDNEVKPLKVYSNIDKTGGYDIINENSDIFIAQGVFHPVMRIRSVRLRRM